MFSSLIRSICPCDARLLLPTRFLLGFRRSNGGRNDSLGLGTTEGSLKPLLQLFDSQMRTSTIARRRLRKHGEKPWTKA